MLKVKSELNCKNVLKLGCKTLFLKLIFRHCVQTIAPAEYSSMFPDGVQLPHETGPGSGELPPGEGCYTCNVGDIPLDLPLSKRAKRSIEAFSKIIKGEPSPNWRKDLHGEKNYVNLLKMSGDLVLTDIKRNSHKFRPSILKIVKREAMRKKVPLSFSFCNNLSMATSAQSYKVERRRIFETTNE